MKSNIDPTDVKPCPHMRTLVPALVDGELKGLAKWYTERHVRHCAQCLASVPFLEHLSARLAQIDAGREREETSESTALPPERWASVQQAWDEADSVHK